MLRAYFTKEGSAVWISHLDLMRVLQRSFRRAGLLLKHSKGYTPHPSLSLAIPLPVGTSSRCEIMDFDLDDEQNIEITTLADTLNAVLPAGIHIQEVCEGGTKIKELTHLNVAITMEYDAGVPIDCEDTLQQFLSQDVVLMNKRTKSGELIEVNICGMIDRITVKRLSNDLIVLDAVICAQNPSLNPVMILESIKKYIPEYAPSFSSYQRLAFLNSHGEIFR